MEDGNGQGRIFEQGTWSMSYVGFEYLVIGTIVAVVSIAYVARYLAYGRPKSRSERDPFRQKTSEDKGLTTDDVPSNCGADSAENDANRPISIAAEVVSEDVIIQKRLDKLENVGTNDEIGDGSREDNASKDEYRRIVDDEEYIDLCPTNDTESKCKRKPIVNNVNITDKSLTLRLIKEEVQDDNPVKETPPVSTESIPFVCELSTGNQRSLVVNENASSIRNTTSTKSETTEYKHVYNELENETAHSQAGDKGTSYLSNEFSLIADVDETHRNEEKLTINEISDVGPDLQYNEVSPSRPGIGLPTVIISEHYDAVDRNHNIEQETTLKRHRPELSRSEPLRIDLGLKHLTNTEDESDTCNGTIETQSLIISMKSSATANNEMATPEDIACFYQDTFQDEEQTSACAPSGNGSSNRDNSLGEIIETSFVTVIPNSLDFAADDQDMAHESRGTRHENDQDMPHEGRGTRHGNDSFPECNAGSVKGANNLDCYDEVGRTDTAETENDQEDEEDEADDDEDDEGEDEEKEEDSDESGGLETIEEVSEEEFDSGESFNNDDTTSINDTFKRQHYKESTKITVIENTHETPDPALDDQYEQTINGRLPPEMETDVTGEHFDVCEHNMEQCYSVPTASMPDLNIHTSTKIVEGSDLVDLETETLVGGTNLESNKRTDTENDFVNNKQDGVTSLIVSAPNQYSSLNYETLQKNDGDHSSDFDLKQTSVGRESSDHVTAKQEVQDNSHDNNGEVTRVELEFNDRENQLNYNWLQRIKEEIDLLQGEITEKPSELNDNIQNNVITDMVPGDARVIDDPIEGSRCEPIYGTIDDHDDMLPISDLIPFEFDKPFTEIKELERIRPLPFLTEVEHDTVWVPITSNTQTFDEQGDIIRDGACVEPVSGQNGTQHKSVHRQIKHNETEVLIDTPATESQLDSETPLSTFAPSLGIEDNSYSDDMCTYDLTSPSQCSGDQVSVEQINQQTGKQTVTIELHLVRRKPNSDTVVKATSVAKEDLICATSSNETARPPQSNTEKLHEKSKKTKDETNPPRITTDVITEENVGRSLDKARILRNVDEHAADRRSFNDSNDDLARSYESVTSNSTGSNRTLSVQEKRVLDSLKNLQLPEWYKKSDIHKRKMKNMADGNVWRSDSGTVYGPNRFYGRPKSSSFDSEDIDCNSTKYKPVCTRMSYERKAKYYYSTQHIPTRRPSDDYRNTMLASTPYLKTQSNYDIHRFDSENKIHAGDDMYSGKSEFPDQSRITERPQSDSDLANIDPIPMNNFKIQRQRSNKGTATFYITSVHVQNKNTKQNEANYAYSSRESDSGFMSARNTKCEDNNEMDQVVKINNGAHNNRNASYLDEVRYKHSPYTYTLVYGTPQALKEKELADESPVERLKCDKHETLPETKEYYTVSDHKDYHASIVECEDDKVSDLSSSNRSNLSPDITNDSAINLENMSSGPDSESYLSYDESSHSGSVYVPSVTHSAPPFIEEKHNSQPTDLQINIEKTPGRRKISSSYDDVSKQQRTYNRMSSLKSRTRTPGADGSLGSKTSPRFPVINRSRDDLLTNGKKDGISISITDTCLDDSPCHRNDEEEFERHLHEPDQQPNSKFDGNDKAIVMENIIDGLLGLTTPSVNNSENFSYIESAKSSSSNLLSSESDSSVTSARRRPSNDPAKKQNTDDDNNHVVHCRKCRTSANLDEARKSFKNCHHCYTYYCSRDCRNQHWEQHKQRCLFARVSSSCKRAIAVCRDDGSTHYTLSKIARTCYLSRGRGCILIVFPNEVAARLFVHYGLRAVPSPPSYITTRDLEKTHEPNEHTNSLLSVCQAYDPNQSFIINVIVNIGTDIPKKPVPRRQGTAIKKCANFSLCEIHVAQPSTRANKTTGETLILTMPPGLPPDGTRDRKLRQVCFGNIQRHLRQREVKLRHQFPSVYSALCRWVEYHESFPPTTIYPTEGSTNRPFMCLIMPESDPDALGWVTNPGLLEDIDMDGELM